MTHILCIYLLLCCCCIILYFCIYMFWDCIKTMWSNHSCNQSVNRIYQTWSLSSRPTCI